MIKRILFFFSLITGFFLFSSFDSREMCPVTAKVCAKHIVPPFISDGQSYRALVLKNQSAEFQATFFSGSIYRIAAASGNSEGNLTFSVYDEDHNLLFSNSQHANAPYWDFRANTTVNVLIEAGLSPESVMESGCAVVLIGFRQ